MNFFRLQGISFKFICTIFILKIAAGTCMWYIYAYHYSDRSTADIFKYFDDSKVLFDALFTSPSDFFKMLFGISNNTSHFAQYYDQMNNWYNKYNSNLYNDSHSIIRINAFMRLFSIGCYHVHTVFISFMTLCGLAGTYHFFNDGLKDKPRVLAIILFLIPSVLFWTSGVVKEAVVFSFIGILLYFLKQFFVRKTLFISTVVITICLLSLFATKLYVLIALFPALVAYCWSFRNNTRTVLIKYLTVYLLFIMTGQAVRVLFPAFDPIKVLRVKQKDFLELSTGGVYLKNDSVTFFIPEQELNSVTTSDSVHYSILPGKIFRFFKNATSDTLYATSKEEIDCVFFKKIPTVHSRIYLPVINVASPTELIRITPAAIRNTLLRPLVPSSNFFITVTAIENWIVLFFVILCLFFSKPIKKIEWNYILMCLTFSLLMYLLIGWVTPVMGAIARYKVPALPFFLIAFLHILDVEKLKSKFSLLTRKT